MAPGVGGAPAHGAKRPAGQQLSQLPRSLHNATCGYLWTGGCIKAHEAQIVATCVLDKSEEKV